MTSTSDQATGGADLARTALRAARRAARTAGNVTTKKPAPSIRQLSHAGRDARDPSALTSVMPAMAAAHGWALGTAQGAMRDNWTQLVGPENAAHWSPAGYNADTRTLRIVADPPAWATKLRLEQRAVLAKLNDARPDGAMPANQSRSPAGNGARPATLTTAVQRAASSAPHANAWEPPPEWPIAARRSMSRASSSARIHVAASPIVRPGAGDEPP